MSDDLIPEGVNMKERRSMVRFTTDEYLRMIRDRIQTGKSIPWLLKTAYFKNGISAPTLDADSRRSIRKELGYIGNNLNQIARALHMQGKADVEKDVRDAIDYLRLMKSFFLRDYGNR